MFNHSNRHLKDLTPEEIYLDKEGRDVSFVEGKTMRWTITIGGILALLLMVGFWGYTFRLQALSSNEENASIYAKTYIEPQRGKIVGKNGTLLAGNSITYDVVVFPGELPQDSAPVLENVARVLDSSKNELQSQIQGVSGQEKLVVAEDVAREAAISMQTNGSLEGVVLKKRQVRGYRYPNIFAHIIGYTGKLTKADKQTYENYLLDETVGKRGVEQVYESQLHGEYGVRDPLNTENVRKSPVPGNSLQLTVDSEFQKTTHKKLKSIVDENEQISKGIAIAMNPQNGEVLSLVSLPTYNANTFIGGISRQKYQKLQDDEGNPLLNKATKGEYAPGSTVKPLLAGAMLQEDVITTESEINDPDGRLVVPNPYNPGNPAIFPDWKPHGRTDVYKAIAKSVNTFFYTFGGGTPDREGLGIERIVKYYQAFGFGSPTGIDLAGERGGRLPYTNLSAQEKERWTRGRTYNVSIGQGTLNTTPLQIATYISAIANGGTLYKPRLVDTMYDFERDHVTKDLQSQVKHNDLLNPQDLQVVQEGMRQGVTNGTGDQLQDLSFKAAAKSGTAQTSNERNNSWFTAYGPYDNPQIVVTVLVPEGEDSGTTAVPVAKHMLQWYKKNRGFE